MSTATGNEIKFDIVPLSTKPTIHRGTNQKYTKILEAAKKLKIAETIRVPLTNSKGETNRNAVQTLNNHVKSLQTKSNGKSYQMIVSSINEGTKEKPNVYAYIFYEQVEPEVTPTPQA